MDLARKPLYPPSREIVEREASMSSLARAGIDVASRKLDSNAKSILQDDRVAQLLIRRSAQTPTALKDTEALQQVAVHFVASLVPVSASAAVIARSMQLNFGHDAQLSIPALTLPNAAFVSEGQVIPVVQGTSSPGALVDPYSLKVIFPLTGEMIRNSNAEAFVRQVMLENTAPTLDAAMFSAAAAVPGLRPAGILDGVAALPASTDAATPFDAMVADVAAIATKLAPASGGSQSVLVAAPAQAVALALRSPRELWPVFPSAALPAGTVIGIVPAGLATVIGAPRIEAGADTLMQYDGAPADDPLTAGPTVSLFQADSVALRLILPATWTRRSPAAVAWVENVSW